MVTYNNYDVSGYKFDIDYRLIYYENLLNFGVINPESK